MYDPNFVNPVLVAARRCFRRFYTIAGPDDVTRLDALVCMREELARLISIPRASVPGPDKMNLERACNATEISFMAARNGVRECQAFRSLTARDQRHMAAILFNVYPAGG